MFDQIYLKFTFHIDTVEICSIYNIKYIIQKYNIILYKRKSTT